MPVLKSSYSNFVSETVQLTINPVGYLSINPTFALAVTSTIYRWSLMFCLHFYHKNFGQIYNVCRHCAFSQRKCAHQVTHYSTWHKKEIHDKKWIFIQESFWWWQCSDRYITSLSPHLHTPFPPFSPSLISLMVFVDVKHHVYLLTRLRRSCYEDSVFVLPWTECIQLQALVSLFRNPATACTTVDQSVRHFFKLFACVVQSV